MNLAETARVLAWAAAFDRRTVGEMDVQAWQATLDDLDVEDALEGVTRWYRDRSDWLMPAHLREAVKLIQVDRRRAARLAAAERAAEVSAIEPRRAWADLAMAERERLTALSKGTLERWPLASALVAERFGVEAVYGAEGQLIEGGKSDVD